MHLKISFLDQLFSKNNSQQGRQHRQLYRQIQGWILRLQKNREGVDLPLACLLELSYTKKTTLNRLHFVYKCGVSFTNIAFYLQNLRFVYKYKVFILQTGILLYKLAFRFTSQLWHLKIVFACVSGSFMMLQTKKIIFFCNIYLTTLQMSYILNIRKEVRRCGI